MKYLLDANIFIQAKNLQYGFDFCPAFWDWLDEKFEAGNLASIEKVLDELKAGDDDLSTWAAARPSMFVQPDAPVAESLRYPTTHTPPGKNSLIMCVRGRLPACSFNRISKRQGGGSLLHAPVHSAVHPPPGSAERRPADLPSEIAPRRAAVKGASRPTPAGG